MINQLKVLINKRKNIKLKDFYLISVLLTIYK